MLVYPFYAVSENFLPHHICDDIIKSAVNKKSEEARIYAGTEKSVRDSRLVWIKDPWIFDWINQAVKELNKELDWNFNINEPEEIQFTSYKKGQFYGWHQDIFGHEEAKSIDTQRKISVVIPLVESNEYKGGNLEFYNSNLPPTKKEEDKVIVDELTRTKGNLIIFPSFVWHQVTPVIEGERLSIVLWYRGEKWK
jgi:PKHD-type hydroxylase